MSLEFLDGLDHYTANPARKWDSTSSTGSDSVTGRFGGKAWSVQNSPLILTGTQLSAIATRTVGFAWRPFAFSANPFFLFRDGTSTQLDLRTTGTGQLYITRAGTTLETSVPVLTSGNWVYIEIQATIHSTTGAYTVKVWAGASPGVWLAATNVNTQATANSTMNSVAFPNAGYSEYVDDVYVLNPSGSVNNNFLGDCRIYTSLPSADNASATGTNLLWTPNSGTAHYSRVNEAAPDDDSSYVSSATVGQIDTYQYPDITPTGVIAAVQATLCDRKDDAAARTICAEYRSGAGTNYAGATVHSPTTSYLMHRQIWETDPATSAAWTAANINAGEFGEKVVS